MKHIPKKNHNLLCLPHSIAMISGRRVSTILTEFKKLSGYNYEQSINDVINGFADDDDYTLSYYFMYLVAKKFGVKLLKHKLYISLFGAPPLDIPNLYGKGFIYIKFIGRYGHIAPFEDQIIYDSDKPIPVHIKDWWKEYVHRIDKVIIDRDITHSK